MLRMTLKLAALALLCAVVAAYILETAHGIAARVLP